MANATPARRREADFSASYRLELPYPFLMEPEGAPWFASRQICDAGVKDGIGTASTEMYRVLLCGTEITAAYNAACRKEHGTFTDRAIELQKVRISVDKLRQSQPAEFGAAAAFGVTWASDGFMDLLKGGVEEAKAYAISCRVGAPVTIDTLREITLPVARYDRACKRLGLPANSAFLMHAAQRAYQSLARYAVSERRAPWHPDRSTALDAETAAIIRFCAGAKGVDTTGFDKQMKSFLNMVDLQQSKRAKVTVDVHRHLLDWASQNLG